MYNFLFGIGIVNGSITKLFSIVLKETLRLMFGGPS